MYKPKPEDLNNIELSNDLIELSERIAKNVHEVWAQGRLIEGWSYGNKVDSELKTTPCMVEYEKLPESEKDYDRNTAMQTLKLIIKLGFKIEKEREI